ncbi:host attachment protein [Xanthomonas massiliensis]|uniref:host attachment protein n=1 Tax=Xanthomonas massiliensis TaxID=1720302 RepID=UPI000B20F171|nr:host attachment protein [Xanthomonas massiliensis]
MNKLPAGAWVVVADGVGARVFRVVDGERPVTLEPEERLVLQPDDAQGPSGIVPDEMTPEQLREATFVKQLAKGLNHGATTGQYAHLVLVADPRTLGTLRPLLDPQADERIVLEIHKTLTGATLDAIEREIATAARQAS